MLRTDAIITELGSGWKYYGILIRSLVNGDGLLYIICFFKSKHECSKPKHIDLNDLIGQQW